MSYIKANDVLPMYVIEIIQKYVDGENIYIPKKETERVRWGEKTGAKKELSDRNMMIYQDYLDGKNVSELAERYFLSDKSIQRIIREMRTAESA